MPPNYRNPRFLAGIINFGHDAGCLFVTVASGENQRDDKESGFAAF
jgi:hypothetical protein